MPTPELRNTVEKVTNPVARLLQIQLKLILGTILIKEMRRQHHTGCPRWRGSKCHHQNWEIQLKNWQILVQILAVPNFQIGGARQAAVALQPMHVCKVRQLKSCFKYPDHSNNCTFSPVRAILKPQEASKVKFACFKGIVHPTDIHGSWGTWLGSVTLQLHQRNKSIYGTCIWGGKFKSRYGLYIWVANSLTRNVCKC